MQFFSTFFQTLQHIWLFTPWKDILEIFFFSSIFYYFSRWLNRDKQKNLIFYFYGYCLLSLGSYYAQLATMSTFLFICAPIVALFFIIVHQETLQKNFIALRTIRPAQQDPSDWLETLIRTCLITINNNKEIRCVIEHNDSLAQFITTPLALHAKLQKNLLTMILASDSFEQSKMIWITSTGIVQGINAAWNTELEEQWLSEEAKKLHKWKQDALFFTSKTDALVFKISPETRTFNFVAQGKLFEHVSAHQLVIMVKKYVTIEKPTAQKGEAPHAFSPKKFTTHERDT